MKNFFKSLFLFLAFFTTSYTVPPQFFNQKAQVILPNGVHYTNGIGINGSCVELENGAQFEIVPEDRDEACSWNGYTLLTISPNPYLFSSGDFLLVNSDTKRYVRANYSYGPFLDSPFTYFVKQIRPWSGEIVLTNLSNDILCWKVDSADAKYLQSWEMGDTVLIGHYDTWYSRFVSKSEYILMSYENSDCVKFVRAIPDF